ncbi:hypothetical protein [Paraburkholderia susongensis]|uniref:Uncharacterized protein n=1 Tax=Paraburkholderia susongensis TaxID=1515439 RepID=A0A1X7M785_9BURK|nr:hypothetical protein [Paraburkholderia susongensis]SMG61239.1 hypothetical protein SAMN06265784_12049 [Paraburkholderia susongensis]
MSNVRIVHPVPDVAPVMDTAPAVEITGGTSHVSTQKSVVTPPGPVYTPQTTEIDKPVTQPVVSIKKSVSVVSVQTSYSTGPISLVKVPNSFPAAPDPIVITESASSSPDNVTNTNTSNTGSRAGLEGAKAAAVILKNKPLENSVNDAIVVHSVTSVPYNLFNAITGSPIDKVKATAGLIADSKNIIEATSKNAGTNIQKVPQQIVNLSGRRVDITPKPTIVPSKANIYSTKVLPYLKGTASVGKVAVGGGLSIAQGVTDIQDGNTTSGLLKVGTGVGKTVEGVSELYQLAMPKSTTAVNIANRAKVTGSVLSTAVSLYDTYDGFSTAFDPESSEEQKAVGAIQGSVGATNVVLNGAELLSFGGSVAGGVGAVPVAATHGLLNHMNNTIAAKPNSDRAKIYLNSLANPQNFA